MASRHGSTIEELAEKLERHAQSIPTMYLGLGIVAGLSFGFALGGDTVDIQRLSGISYGLLGAFIGWSAGKSRQTSLRLQASTARKRR